ncbi:hypothetical protein JS82_00610 [Methanomassiliicoccaceae archaeon DOK]|nr:hypothetical protein JS82_00610 [Methanomassiliicoccaceae archaeon DOK]
MLDWYKGVVGVETRRILIAVPVELHSDLLKLYPNSSPLFSNMSDVFNSALRWHLEAVYLDISASFFSKWLEIEKESGKDSFPEFMYVHREEVGFDSFKDLIDMYMEQVEDYKPDISRLQVTVPLGLIKRVLDTYPVFVEYAKEDGRITGKMSETRYYTIIIAAYLNHVHEDWEKLIIINND